MAVHTVDGVGRVAALEAEIKTWKLEVAQRDQAAGLHAQLLLSSGDCSHGEDVDEAAGC